MWAVKLSGKYIATPQRKLFCVPTHTLALAIAHEWDSQVEKIRTSSMPLVCPCVRLQLMANSNYSGTL